MISAKQFLNRSIATKYMDFLVSFKFSAVSSFDRILNIKHIVIRNDGLVIYFNAKL